MLQISAFLSIVYACVFANVFMRLLNQERRSAIWLSKGKERLLQLNNGIGSSVPIIMALFGLVDLVKGRQANLNH